MNESLRQLAVRAVDRAADHRMLPTRSAKLRRMLQSPQLEFLMEAHNGLSARIVRETGFGGIWASGLSISAPGAWTRRCAARRRTGWPARRG